MGYNLIGTHDEQKRTNPPCQLSRKAQLNKHIYEEKDRALPYDLAAAHVVPLQLPSRPSNQTSHVFLLLLLLLPNKSFAIANMQVKAFDKEKVPFKL